MKTKIYSKILGTLLVVLAVLALQIFNGCKEDSVSPNTGTVDLSATGSSASVQDNPVLLEIDQVKLLLKDVKLLVQNNESVQSNFMTGPFVISLDLTSNVKFVVSSSLPAGTYSKVIFEVHKLDAQEVPPDPEFADANGRYSVIIKGRYNGISFVYKSTKSCHQMLMFQNSLLVNVNGKSNITLKVTPYSWFLKNGVILDPMNVININDIDNNIKENINGNFKIFVDNDRNGQPD